MKEYAITLLSGRNLDVSEAGDPDGVPIFFMHGTPGSRLLFNSQVRDAEENNIRLLSYSRPGYGNSTRFRGRKIADAATDVKGIADHLGIDRFAVMGHSGGGSLTLACAALLADRVLGAASIAGVAPHDAEGLDFYAGMGQYNVDDFNTLLTDEAKWEENNRRDMDIFIKGTTEEVIETISTLMCDADRKALSEEYAEMMKGQALEGSSSSLYGLKDDNLSDLSPWGFDPSAIDVPVQIWHGSEDMFVPFAHGQWLANRIPAAESHLEKGEGHISIYVSRLHEIHKWLSDKF